MDDKENADVDKEYDFESEVKRARDYLLQEEKFREKAIRLELELKIKELEKQRDMFSDEDRLIERVIHLFRGRRISQRTYDIIIRELGYCLHPEIDEYYYIKQQQHVREMVEKYKRMMMMPEERFRWDSEEKDFIEEDDMKL